MSCSMLKTLPYTKLMRLDKPTGIWLFLWPTLWSLWLAAGSIPPLKILLVFILGVIVMRSAGCVINDLLDQNFDRYVQRTKNRPLVTGEITSKKAMILFAVLCAIAALLALQLNYLTLEIACIVFILAIAYPLTKRWTYIPQFFLGLTVAGAVPMAFAAIQNQLPKQLWWVYTTALLWPVIYDTMYAMADRQDDAKIGVKSTALLFGQQVQLILGVFQAMLIVLLFIIGNTFSLEWPYSASVGIAALLFLRQQWLIRTLEPQICFKAFLESHWVGFTIFTGIVWSSGVTAMYL